MPAELLMLLIVAFASPSCQVLSSLRMGEALQPPAPASSDTLPLGPGAPCEPMHASPSGPRSVGIRPQLSSAARSSNLQSLLSPGCSSPDPQLSPTLGPGV